MKKIRIRGDLVAIALPLMMFLSSKSWAILQLCKIFSLNIGYFNLLFSILFLLLISILLFWILFIDKSVITADVIRNLRYMAVFIAAYNYILMPPIPLFGPDAVGYFGPTIAYFKRGLFRSIATRGIVYPAFIYRIYRLAGNPFAVLIVQRLLFLSGLMMMPALFRFAYMVFFRPSGKYYRFYQFLSALLSVFVALNEDIVAYTSFFHPESLTVFFYLLLSLLCVRIMYAIRYNSRLTVFLVLLGLVLPIAYFHQPRWLLLLPAVFFYFAALLYGRGKYKELAVYVIITLVCYFGTDWTNKKYLSNDHLNKYHTSKILFSANMNMIVDLMRVKMQEPGVKDYELLKKTSEVYEESKIPIAGRYPSGYSETLGYNVDYVLFGGLSDYIYRYYMGNDDMVNNFFKDWFVLAVKNRPMNMVLKVFNEFAAMNILLPKFFGNSFGYNAMLGLTTNIANEWSGLFKNNFEQEKLVRLYSYSENLKYRQDFGLPKIMLIICSFMNKLYVPVLIIWLLVLLYGKYLGINMSFPLIFLLMPFSISFGIGAVFMVQPTRYSNDMQIMSLLMMFFCVVSILENISKIISRKPNNG
jgi:hypothetical protein